MFRVLIQLLIIMGLCTACTSSGTTSSSNGVVVIGYYKIIGFCPNVVKLENEDDQKAYQTKVLAMLKTQNQMMDVMNDELKQIVDKKSLDYKNKMENHLYKIKKYQEKIIDLSMTRVIARMKAFDVAYKQMETVALQVAKKMGANTVLPIEKMPSPNPKIEYPKNVIRNPEAVATEHWEHFRSRILDRKTFAHDPRIDITNKVYEELKNRYQWK